MERRKGTRICGEENICTKGKIMSFELLENGMYYFSFIYLIFLMVLIAFFMPDNWLTKLLMWMTVIKLLFDVVECYML